MRLAGLQKLTLLDYPGELACTVFTQGCGLRCPFCQNADLVLPERFAQNALLPEDAFFSFLESRKGKLGAAVVSGGEPTMHGDLPEFLARIRSMGFKVKLDTNGTDPEMLESILDRGLCDYVAMDVKNTPDKYPMTCGIPEGSRAELLLAHVRKSISVLMHCRIPYEFRTTVAEGLHTEEDITRMAQWLAGAEAWYLQQFVPGDCLVGSGDGTGMELKSPSAQLLQSMCEAARAYVPAAGTRGI